MLVAVLAVQWWVATAGTATIAIPDARYSSTLYRQQADAFTQGQLSLLATPPANLAALPDPYEPAARAGVCAIHDVSYYDGRYFLYFGPLPAITLLVGDWLSGDRLTSDSVAAIAGVVGLTVVAAALVWRVWRDGPSGAPLILPASALVAVGLGNPIPFLLSSPAVYQAAIATGQVALLGGILAALTARRSGRWAGVYWLVAGTAWGLVPLARASLIPAVLLFVVVAAIALRHQPRRLALLLGPLVLLGAVAGWYNAARFDTPFEFGQRYQLTDLNLHRDYAGFFSADNLATNAGLFFLRPPEFSTRFPFIGWPPASERRATMREASTGAIIEPTVGLLTAAPYVLLAVGALWAAPGRRRDLLLLAGGTVAAAAPVLLQRWVSMRYLADFMPLAVLLAFGGSLALWQRRTAVASAAAVILALGTAAFGVLLAVTGYSGHFERHNPALFAALGGEAAGPRLVPLGARFGDLVELTAYRFEPERVLPGEEATLLLDWRRLRPDGAVVRSRLIDSAFRPLAEGEPFPLPDADGQQRLSFRLPPDASGPDYLAVEIAVESDGHRLAIRDRAGKIVGDLLTVRPLRLATITAWPPPGVSERDVRFGEEMRLEGVQLSRDGRSLTVELFWQGGWIEEERLITLRVVDAAGREVASARGAPGGGWYPTLLWRPGDQIHDEWEILLPEQMPGGPFRLMIEVDRCAGPIVPRGNPAIAIVE